MKIYFSHKFIFILMLIPTLLGVVACGTTKLDSANITAGQSVSLVAEDGSIPLILVFESAPTSGVGLTTDETIGITFTGLLDIREAASPIAFAAIQGTAANPAPIELELRFIDINREVQIFDITPIAPNDPLTKTIMRQAIPFPIENVAIITFVVDRKEVAQYPQAR